ncbi:MAG: rhodanese-like domain-containing protein [Pseudonocardiales bacterium]
MVTEVGLPDLEQALNNGALLLDVREYAEGHIPGAQLLPLSVLPVRMHELPRDRPVYVACQAGGRSAQAAKLLTRAGVDARPVTGGTAAWISSGRAHQTGFPRS